eukprot:5538188-Alexandrium_andersonii.AAC.1
MGAPRQRGQGTPGARPSRDSRTEPGHGGGDYDSYVRYSGAGLPGRTRWNRPSPATRALPSSS